MTSRDDCNDTWDHLAEKRRRSQTHTSAPLKSDSFAVNTGVTALVVLATMTLVCVLVQVVVSPGSVLRLSLLQTAVAGLDLVTEIDGGTRLSLLQTLAGIAVAATIALEATVRRGQSLALEMRAGGRRTLLTQELKRLAAVTRVEWFVCVLLISACVFVAASAGRNDVSAEPLEVLVAVVLAGWILNEVRKVHASMAFAYDVYASERNKANRRAELLTREQDPRRRRAAWRLVSILLCVLTIAPSAVLAPLDLIDILVMTFASGSWIFVAMLTRAAAIDRFFGDGVAITTSKYLLSSLVTLVAALTLMLSVFVHDAGSLVLVGMMAIAALVIAVLVLVALGFAGYAPLHLLQELVRSDVARRYHQAQQRGPDDVLLQ
jgi:hypothetical protein